MRKLSVGGQAVIEGVMMRAPSSLAVVVRRSNGEITSREDAWRSVGARYPVLSWPLVRGTVVLIESLVHGLQALNFSAGVAIEDELPSGKESSKWALAAVLIFALSAGLGLFVALPHLLAYWGGRLPLLQYDVDSMAFHLVDGGIKLFFFLAYVKAISLFPDIQRVFQYHGAEHKAIFTYESGEELIVENARKYPTLHPRCGTSFILLVLFISIIIFSVVFPLFDLPRGRSGFTENLGFIGLKMLLMFPVAGLAYEAIRWGAKHMNLVPVKMVMAPGLWLQRMTTLPPADEQLEVALLALARVISLEKKRGVSSAAIV